MYGFKAKNIYYLVVTEKNLSTSLLYDLPGFTLQSLYNTDT